MNTKTLDVKLAELWRKAAIKQQREGSLMVL